MTLPLGLYPLTEPATPEELSQATANPAEPFEFSLLVAAPGEICYELEGHAGMRLRDPATGTDLVVNWGLFEFARPNFAYHFVKGETDYHIGAMPTDYFVWQYARQGRRVTEFILDLTPEEKQRMLDFIDTELSEGHNVYRYNYVKDNCATRPLIAIETAVGDTVANLPLSDETGRTYREVMRYYHRNYPWYQFGIDLALGPGIDYPLKAREKLFAPTEMDRMMAVSTFGTDSLGRPRRVISAVNYLSDGTPEGNAAAATPWYLTPMAASLLLLAAGVALTLRDLRRRRTTRWFDSALYSIFAVAGTVVAFLVFISLHEATSPNWVLLWLNPLALVPAIGIWLKKAKRMVVCYQFINFGAVFALLIIGACGVQSLNAAFYPLMVLDMFRAFSYIRINR
ncbi:MAG: DUF4105 domain-containing protein [Clostridium sp.]|nr:DUF4105 domain-containing protein [Clostridium sp.]